MTIDEFNTFLKNLPEEIMSIAPDIVAETASEYYKGTFSKKAFDGNMWVAGKPKKRGSLLIYSGNMMNSIQVKEANAKRVVIAAGGDKVTYAKIHNEGYDGKITVPEHIRIKKGKNKKVIKGVDVVHVCSYTRTMHIPQRQFLGISKELNQTIVNRLQAAIDSILKK